MGKFIYLICEIIVVWFWFWLGVKLNFDINVWWSLPYVLTGITVGIIVGLFVLEYFDNKE